MLRYLVTSAIQEVHKAAAKQLPWDAVRDAFHRHLRAFCRALPELEAALGIAGAPGVPRGLAAE